MCGGSGGGRLAGNTMDPDEVKAHRWAYNAYKMLDPEYAEKQRARQAQYRRTRYAKDPEFRERLKLNSYRSSARKKAIQADIPMVRRRKVTTQPSGICCFYCETSLTTDAMDKIDPQWSEKTDGKWLCGECHRKLASALWNRYAETLAAETDALLTWLSVEYSLPLMQGSQASQ